MRILCSLGRKRDRKREEAAHSFATYMNMVVAFLMRLGPKAAGRDLRRWESAQPSLRERQPPRLARPVRDKLAAPSSSGPFFFFGRRDTATGQGLQIIERA